jgi:hypothetical protein
MHEDLWAGVELKLQHASFFLNEMSEALLPPTRTAENVALESSGAIFDTRWQTSFYAYLDAFLAMARSVPEIISSCFGADQGSKDMKDWFASLAPAEQTRRRGFAAKFQAIHTTFRALPLSGARNISLHRSGVAPVDIKITGRFGVSYTGTPVKRIPSSETPQLHDPDFQWLARSVPLQPSWEDFEINGQPLFAECKAYVHEAQRLLNEARRICQQVHGSDTLTPPPS